MKKLLIRLVFVTCLCIPVYSQESKPTATPAIGSGQGDSGQQVTGSGDSIANSNLAAQPLRILAKPRANYTDEARKNGDEGIVRIRVTFLASGELGAVTPVNSLPNGLTEQAVSAAKQLKFTPQISNGQRVSVTKTVEYSFEIYYKENDKDVKQNAEILEMPAPENPSGATFKSSSGKVHILLALTKTGNLHIIQVDSNLPQEFKQKAIDAASKIKFKPAIHKNGKEVSQTKEIEYEFKPQTN